jgi:hypothetical protein
MVVVSENKGFQIVFDAYTQTYTVYRDGKFIIGNKYRFVDVSTYVA